MGCCSTGYSTRGVCGEFTKNPPIEDNGRCHPYREKRDCGIDPRPLPPCNDMEAYMEYFPDSTGDKFVAVAALFDESCLNIQDENGLSILTSI